MKRLLISQVDSIDRKSSLTHISAELNNLEKNLIAEVPWQSFTYKPGVTFAISYNDCIFIKYFVNEKAVRAVYGEANQPVYKDSCVEFFISFNGEANYYNLEFNCIGTCLIGYGADRSGRSFLPEKLINTIRHRAFINSSNDFEGKKITWELTLIIPLEVFAYHNIESLKGRLCKGNFFKCGDELSEPHFLAWNGIIADLPDFHLPQFFGDIHFI